MSYKIPQSVEAELAAKVARGESLTQMHEWLSDKKGVTISRSGLAKWAQRLRKQSSADARATIEAHVTSTLPTDLDEWAQIRAINRELLKAAQEKARSNLTPGNVRMIVELSSVVQRDEENARKMFGDEKTDFVGSLADLMHQFAEENEADNFGGTESSDDARADDAATE